MTNSADIMSPPARPTASLGTPPHGAADLGRRRFFGGALAVPAALALPTVAIAAGSTDPIFAAIDVHKAAWGVVTAIENEANEHMHDVFDDRFDIRIAPACHAAEIAAAELTNVKPTTIAGAIALLRYAVEFEKAGNDWPEDMVDDDDDRLNTQPGSSAHEHGYRWSHFVHANIADLLEAISRDMAVA